MRGGKEIGRKAGREIEERSVGVRKNVLSGCAALATADSI
jgi:hypothetical protein